MSYDERNWETSQKIKEEVSECFNHRELASADSAYMRLSKLLTETYGMHHWDAESLANTLEEVAAEFILDNSPKLNDTQSLES